MVTGDPLGPAQMNDAVHFFQSNEKSLGCGLSADRGPVFIFKQPQFTAFLKAVTIVWKKLQAAGPGSPNIKGMRQTAAPGYRFMILLQRAPFAHRTH